MAPNQNIRKFIDVVRQICGMWANWDLRTPVSVGDYGTLNANGELIVEGNIYDHQFQESLNKNGCDLDLRSYPPQMGDPEQDRIVTSTGVKKGKFKIEKNAYMPRIASASIKGTWTFKDGQRGALVILRKPRKKSIPSCVEKQILATKLLDGKKLVTEALACPAYLLYLSDKTGREISVALCPKAAASDVANAEVGFEWWTSDDNGFLRRACNSKGEYRFTPLFTLREKVKSWSWLKFWRGEGGSGSPDSDQYTWQDVYQPWRPLDEDGEEIDE